MRDIDARIVLFFFRPGDDEGHHLGKSFLPYVWAAGKAFNFVTTSWGTSRDLKYVHCCNGEWQYVLQ